MLPLIQPTAVSCLVPTGYMCEWRTDSALTCAPAYCADGYEGGALGGSETCTSATGSWELSGCTGRLHWLVDYMIHFAYGGTTVMCTGLSW